MSNNTDQLLQEVTEPRFRNEIFSRIHVKVNHLTAKHRFYINMDVDSGQGK